MTIHTDLPRRASVAQFDQFFDAHFAMIANGLIETDPEDGLRRVRSAFATAYRFWVKVDSDTDAIALIRADLASQSNRPRRGRSVASDLERAHVAPADLDRERGRVVALGRRRRLIGHAGLAVMGGVAVAVELLIAHR
ncbi:MAG: hypothetical protein HY828_21060 [Actinobacteria bacterium]|nr:hypothetical protein [Actinomycetota bacterium]